MKQFTLSPFFFLLAFGIAAQSPSVTLPTGGGNVKSGISQRIGTTDVKINWDAPGVKGREGWQVWFFHCGLR